MIRGEGVGRAPDGRRVYFGERSTPPWGSWAERTVVPDAEVWDVPDDVDDRTAITMGIAGTGALAPLERAEIQKGDAVLVVGATGTIGQLSLQLARYLGAGRVVAASRNPDALARLQARGWADAVVALGGEDDVARLKAASGGEGFDVVMDLVFGQPFLSALRATRWGARLVTIGAGAGATVPILAGDLLFRTMTVVGTGQRTPDYRQRIWRRLLKLAAEQNLTVDYADYAFDQAGAAWAAQQAGPHAKITARIPR